MIVCHISFRVLNFTLHNVYKHLHTVLSSILMKFFLVTIKIFLMRVLNSCGL